MLDNENSHLPPESLNTPLSDRDSIDETSSPEVGIENDQGTSEPDISIVEDKAPQKEESCTRQVVRKIIRWSFGLLIIFGLGFLTAVFTIYNPKVDELDKSQNDLDSAGITISDREVRISAQQDEINSLNEQINELNQVIKQFKNENQELSGQQDSYSLRIALLKARVDIVSAQVKLYEENPTQARVLLESASQTLTTIETLLPDDLQDIIAPLQARLKLAIGGINEDLETALDDLSKIAGDLQEIENAKVWE